MNKLCFGIFIIFLAVITLILSTLFLISDPSEEFSNYLKIEKPQVLDRNNVALNITYENDWNLHDLIKLEDVPYFLQQAFVQAEDKRFFKHNGIDWLARLNALWGNLVGKKIRGASTITQQVVQMLHPRQRNIWSKWLEGWEAVMLEQKFTKSQILEFYINQVPYSKRNRGIVAGARYYFNSDVALLNKKSMLALALIVRSPNRFDLHKTNSLQDKSFLALAQKLHKNKVISKKDIASILKQPLRIDKAKKNYEIYHFVKYIIDNFSAENKVTIQTTLDLELQKEADLIAHRHLKKLATHKVNNIGLIVVENISNEVLAWVVANSDNSDTKFYDSIISKRQAGSTLKPFLYSMALESGYNAATIIDDSRIDQAVGSGVHQFSNYSHHYYGPVTLRQALANSLNVPAIKTIDDLGVENFLSLLHMLGFESLDKPAQIYGTGLALGNGEIMLLELVRAFSVLSNKGILKDLKFVKDQYSAKGTRIFKSSTTSIINNILSDKVARSLEFVDDINFTSQVAFKTGTSTDFRDAWIVGYNSNYLVGIWLGNLDNSEMDGVTGSIGALPILQEILTLLYKKSPTSKLYMDDSLIKKEICVKNGVVKKALNCSSYTEFFATEVSFDSEDVARTKKPEIIFPTQNLVIAIDPKTPRNEQKLKIGISDLIKGDKIKIFVDGNALENKNYLYPLEEGTHIINATIDRGDSSYELKPVLFRVLD